MKKLISIIIIIMMMCMCIPTINAATSFTLKEVAPLAIPAINYSRGFDASANSSSLPVESSAISYNQGDWVEYDINVKGDGSYKLEIEISRGDAGSPYVVVSWDGVELTDVPLNTSPDWMTPAATYVCTINTKKGMHTLKVYLRSSEGCYLRTIRLGAEIKADKSEGQYRTAELPTIIEAEDFDTGISGYKSLDDKNQGNSYRYGETADIYEFGENEFYLKMVKGEFAKYTFDVMENGIYTMKLSQKASGSGEIYFDDLKTPVSFDAKGLFEEKAIVSVYLEAGKHSFKIIPTSDSLEYDYFRFVTGGEESLSLDEIEQGLLTDKPAEIYKTIWVSADGDDSFDGTEEKPFKTLGRAKEEVAKISDDMSGDIIVNIMPGMYYLDKTEVFAPEHGGKNGYRVIYKGGNVYEKPIIHGGALVEGWEKLESGIWKAPLDLEYVRELYIDDQPAIRARSKYCYTVDRFTDETEDGKTAGFATSKINFPESFSRPQDLETCWQLQWVTHYSKVEDLTYGEDEVIFHMQQPEFSIQNSTSTIQQATDKVFYLENALELLDEPGEFYYNRDEKTVYYYPYKEQNLNAAKVYAPKTEVLLKAEGTDLKNKIQNITFDNLDFRYGTWYEPNIRGAKFNQADVYMKTKGTIYEEEMIPGQIAVNRADGIEFLNSRFSCLGSAALTMHDAVSNSTVNGNVFKNIAGTGVTVGTRRHWNPVEGMEQCDGVTVSNNVFRRIGLNYHGTTAICGYFENNISFIHNDIEDVPYTGISAGWGWGSSSVTTKFKNYNISYNRIVNVTQTATDGAHIYTLGNMPGTEIKYNYLLHSEDKRGGVYTDSGSRNITVHHNVMEEVGVWWLQGLYDTLDNRGYHNYTTTSKHEQTSNNIVEDVIWVPSGEWTGEALEIVENAGLEKEYIHLLDEGDSPEWIPSPYDIPRSLYKWTVRDWYEAEDFLYGGEGVGYHKITPAIGTMPNRCEEAVGALRSICSFRGWTIDTVYPGEWLAYEIEVPESGMWAIDTLGGCAADGMGFKIYVDGEVINEFAPMVNTIEWRRYEIGPMGEYYLEKGKHTIKFEFAGGGFYFDAFSLRKADEPLVYEETSPDFDEGKIISYDEFVVEKDEKEKTIFDDVDGHWAEYEITTLAEYGIINGMTENMFEPDSELTKKQATLLTLRALHITHTDETWANEAIANGIIIDDSRANEVITREEFASIISGALKFKLGETKLDRIDSNFNDEHLISPTYIKDVWMCSNEGLLKGDENGYFNPQKSLTRAEAATIIKRLLAV